jgi:NADH-quinone oxidoreductase subunit E
VGLFLLIVLSLIVAAALGWVVRGARLQSESDRLAGDWQTRLDGVAGERDRLQGELAAARDDKAALERAERAAAERAAAGDPELTARATRLERELEQARAANAKQRAEIERLEARAAELQAGAATAPAATSATPTMATPPGAGAAAAERASTDRQAMPPPSLTRPEGQPDDLKQINGIGPGIEKILHGLGIFHFRQIAAFTPENVAWVDQHLRFHGRIEREDWIGQARRFAAGG